jgi:hypothetical protein
LAVGATLLALAGWAGFYVLAVLWPVWFVATARRVAASADG